MCGQFIAAADPRVRHRGFGPERRNGDYPCPSRDVLFVCAHNAERKEASRNGPLVLADLTANTRWVATLAEGVRVGQKDYAKKDPMMIRVLSHLRREVLNVKVSPFRSGDADVLMTTAR